jgi:uncharacterized protein YecE (DUF72 family)
VNDPQILLGTSSFYSLLLVRIVLSEGMRPADYLAFYAEHFHTVELDSTFYAYPSVQAVGN